MKRSTVAVTLAMLAVAGASYAVGVSKSTMKAATEIQWEDYAPGSPLKVARLWGDRTKGAYGMFLKVPAGMELPVHKHTADYNGVTVTGTWVHWVDGAEASKKELPPGSHVLQAGKEFHGDSCMGTTDCIILIQQAAKGDYTPKEAPKK